jgi:hypothetical protein
VSSNMLTIASTAAGIVVGFLSSWWFSRSSQRHSQAERETLMTKIATLQGLLSGVAESISARPTMAGGQADQVVRDARLPDKVADEVGASVRSAESVSNADVFVRASLGALLNEHGEVSVPRLMQEVTHALPGMSSSSIVSSLEALRRSGRVSWSGDDPRKADVIKVHPI